MAPVIVDTTHKLEETRVKIFIVSHLKQCHEKFATREKVLGDEKFILSNMSKLTKNVKQFVLTE